MNQFEAWLSTYQPRVIPDRPWWRLTFHPDQMKLNGMRSWSAVRADGYSFLVGTKHVGEESDCISPRKIEAMAAYDSEHPIPAPPPTCGQVWSEMTGIVRSEVMITAVVYRTGGAPIYALNGMAHDAWPPANAVLVSGVGAPWAPAGWKP